MKVDEAETVQRQCVSKDLCVVTELCSKDVLRQQYVPHLERLLDTCSVNMTRQDKEYVGTRKRMRGRLKVAPKCGASRTRCTGIQRHGNKGGGAR